jgi:hypothetical protein
MAIMLTKTENGETIAYTLGSGDRLASWSDGAYSYDAAGCVTRIERNGKPTLDLTWNGLYQFVECSQKGMLTMRGAVLCWLDSRFGRRCKERRKAIQGRGEVSKSRESVEKY